jgi:hypothetical protein
MAFRLWRYGDFVGLNEARRMIDKSIWYEEYDLRRRGGEGKRSEDEKDVYTYR